MSALDKEDMAHAEWDELSVGWALRALEPDDEGRFSTHLLSCLRCQASIQSSAEVLTDLMNQLPLQSPSPELRARLLDQVGRIQPVPRPLAARLSLPRPGASSTIDLGAARDRSRNRRFGSSWTTVRTLATAAAAVLIMAGLGIWNINLQSERDSATAVATDRGAILQDLATAGELRMTPLRDGDGEAVATLVTGSRSARVLTTGLATNDRRNEIYVLWGLKEVGEPQPLGTFDVVTGDLDLRTVGTTASGIDAFNGYALTLESGRRAPEAPTLPMVASGQVTA